MFLPLSLFLVLSSRLTAADGLPAGAEPADIPRTGDQPAVPPLELRDGDRIVFLGNTFVEREQRYSYLEFFLTARHPDLHLTFRNLGWSGDNVWGHSRTLFDPLDAGFARIEQAVKLARPTVVLVAYGMNESFDGEAGLPQFVAGLNRLLDMLAGTGSRLAVISPIRHEAIPAEKSGLRLPDPAPHNRWLELYVTALQKVASERKLPFVDLFHLPADTSSPLTDNGIQPTEHGYWLLGQKIATQLGHAPDPGRMTGDTAESLRRTIVEKNQLFFHRWRPQNETYIFGFRRNEQGRNAVEIPRFDPLVEAKEKVIAKLSAAVAGKGDTQ